MGAATASLALIVSVSNGAKAADSLNGADGFVGQWLTQDKDGIFEIKPCGQALCGWLVGLDYTDEVPRDFEGRSECRLEMLTDFTPIDDRRWQGRILDPRSGHSYQARIWKDGPQVLKLRGFVLGVPLLGSTQKWTRYDGPAVDTECHMVKTSQ
ncbi:DUF2147 domain-containing protein [Neokomagataea tanensis]|uniref:DUF2147 domain-containing protein n=1 Tax=Neokomagataea tanensis TaxID=661191 RepID=A0A4Y6V9X0_9PROT|nr:DUF2147 domain-containing protein [Neokomagataea tanensis]